MKPKVIISGLCVLTVAAVLAVVVFSRHHPPPADAKTFEVIGQVRSVDTNDQTIRITHEEIPDFMPAMTMPFPVKDRALLRGLSAGDRVQFELVVTDDDSWIARIEKIRGGASVGPAATGGDEGVAATGEAERVQVGELVPDFTLTNQAGRVIHLRDFRGKAVLLTFIYTRCPLPNFCPLMSKNFSELEHRLSREFTNRFHLVSVTMDPKYDTPQVLTDYAARYQSHPLSLHTELRIQNSELSTSGEGVKGERVNNDANPRDWTFATGSEEQIQYIAGLMGLYYTWEGGLISHDLRTALIGPDGKLVHLWKSNVWTPYEVQRMVRETLAGAKGRATR